MIQRILWDFYKRHKSVWWWLGFFCFLSGISDGNFLHYISACMPLIGLRLYEKDKIGGGASAWKTLPINYKHLLYGLFLGMVLSILYFLAIRSVGFAFYHWLENSMPNDLNPYVSNPSGITVWYAFSWFGWFCFLMSFRKPDELNWSDLNPIQWVLLSISGILFTLSYLLILTFSVLFYPTIHSASPFLLIVLGALLTIIGLRIFIRRENGEFPIFETQSLKMKRFHVSRKRLPGLLQTMPMLQPNNILSLLVVGCFILWMFSVMSGDETAESKRLFACGAISLIFVFSIVNSSLSLVPFLRPLSNFRILPLSTITLCMNILVLLIFDYLLLILALCIYVFSTFDSSLVLTSISILIWLYAISIISLLLKPQDALDKMTTMLIVFAILLIILPFIYLGFLPVFGMGPKLILLWLQQPLLAYAGLGVIAIEAFFMYRLIGFSDVPYPPTTTNGDI